MSAYDARLRELQEQVSRYRKLLSVVEELQRQQETYAARARELESAMGEEQADVDRLEGRSLAAFFYHITGRLEGKLDKERREAWEARVKYDAAARELSETEEELRQSQAELYALRGCEERYETALAEKAQAIKAAGGDGGAALWELETRLAEQASQCRELREAIDAGRAARDTAEKILDDLGSAEGWGTFDLLGGGLMTDIIKYSHLDGAQGQIEQLQSRLRRFKTELADVAIDGDLQVSVDGFLRFADYFFDGLFADWAVLDRIHQSQEQVRSTRDQIGSVLMRLEAMLDRTEREQAEDRARRDRLVWETEVPSGL